MKLPKNIRRTFTLQLDSSDCGVACLRSVIRYHKGDASPERIRELSGTTPQGTTLLGLIQASESLGLQADAFNSASVSDLLTLPDPAILHVLIDQNQEHYVVWYGKTLDKITNDKLFIIGDPAKGLVTISENELYSIWKSRALLTLTPTDQLTPSRKKQQDRIKWLLRHIFEDIGLLTICVVLGLLMALLGVSMTIFTQKLVDDFLPEASQPRIFGGIALLTLLLLMRTALETLRAHFLLEQSRQFNNRITGSFIGKLLQLPKRFFDSRKTGDLIARLNDAMRIQRVVGQVAGAAIIDLLGIFSSLALAFYYSPPTGRILLLSLPIYTFVVYRFQRPVTIRQREMMEAYARNESNYISTVQGIRAIKSFNRQEIFHLLNRTIYGRFQDSIFRLGSLQRKLNLEASVAGTLLLLSILTFTCYQVLHHQMKTGELLALVGLSASMIPQVAGLCLTLIPLSEAKVAFERVYEFQEIEPESFAEKEASTVNLGCIETLSMQNITFRFPGRKPILRNFSLELRRGEVVGLVAESGTGKTTIIQLIEDFYQPESGRITVNGDTPLQDVALKERRAKIATVPQDIEFFSGSVLENILSFSQNSSPSQIAKEDSLFLENNAFIPFYQRLPQGLQTQIGEGGINISGGQKQWIGIMRALIRQPEVLLLDEATAAMDSISEQQVLSLLKEIKSSTAILFVSHRLHILPELCDRIYVVDSESKVTHGSHEELIGFDNLYGNFWSSITNSVPRT